MLSRPRRHASPLPAYNLAGALSLVAVLVLVLATPRISGAFGDSGGFDPRVLLTGSEKSGAWPSAPETWSKELISRTSAPARRPPSIVHATDKAVGYEPFLYWSGRERVASLSSAEITNLRKFFALGGMLVVDDASVGEDGSDGPFGTSAKHELERILTDVAPIALAPEHVVFRSFYLLRRGDGRLRGKPNLMAMARGTTTHVLFTNSDLGGALARGPSGLWEAEVNAGQREQALRFAVNIAMYSLCSNYKDDQVHAPFIMRRRALGPFSPP